MEIEIFFCGFFTDEAKRMNEEQAENAKIIP
jgi:hypothetical protein